MSSTRTQNQLCTATPICTTYVFIWTLKIEKIVTSIKWKIYIIRGRPASTYCRLCLAGRFFMINSIRDNQALQKRFEPADQRSTLGN